MMFCEDFFYASVFVSIKKTDIAGKKNFKVSHMTIQKDFIKR